MPLCIGIGFLSILKKKGEITAERKRYHEEERNGLFLDSHDCGSWQCTQLGNDLGGRKHAIRCRFI